MKAFEILFVAITALTACTKNSNGSLTTTNDNNMTTTVAGTDSLTYLALGDSYTVGEAEPQLQSFPYQLKNLLISYSVKVSSPKVIATTGWTTDDLINGISQSDVHGKTYDFVTLLIGVNDQYQHLSQDNYRVKFAQVLASAITFAKGDTSRVFVLSIPDWGVTPFAAGQDVVIGPQIDQFNSINKSISLQAGVHYLDITGISREASYDATLIAPDGLHPSGKMYGLWVNLLEPMVKARLTR